MLRPACILALSSFGLALAACQEAPSETAKADAGLGETPEPFAQALVSDASGSEVGSVTLTSMSDTVTISLSGSGLEPGEKAFHLHTTGACDAPDFKSAQGHLNPFAKTHGSQSEGGMHLGDLPNITVNEDGGFKVDITIEEPLSEIREHILDEDGTAVMIHAGPDDYVTDPTGNAGGRVACGILRSVQAESD